MNLRLSSKRMLQRILNKAGFRVERLHPPIPIQCPRFAYQSKYVSFGIQPGDRVLDVGCGGDPFPPATVVADMFIEQSHHRNVPLKTNGKSFVKCAVECMPFPDKEFDFVYCSHVLEHIDDPIAGCKEIMRVGKRGYIETPSLVSDVLLSWARGMHKWYVTAVARRLVFVEYSGRLVEGIGSDYFRDALFGPNYHPFQTVFHDSRDLFVVMFPWDGAFSVDVYLKDGRSQRFDPENRTSVE